VRDCDALKDLVGCWSVGGLAHSNNPSGMKSSPVDDVTQDETAPVSESGYTSAVGRDQSSLGSSQPMIKPEFTETSSFRSKSGFVHDINCGRSFPVGGWRKPVLPFTGPTDSSVTTSLKCLDSPEIYPSFDQRVRVSVYPSARSSKKSASFCIKPKGMAIHDQNIRDDGIEFGKEYAAPVDRSVPRIEVSDISNGQVLVTSHIKNFWVVPRPEAGPQDDGRTCVLLGARNFRCGCHTLRVGDCLHIASVGIVVIELHNGHVREALSVEQVAQVLAFDTGDRKLPKSSLEPPFIAFLVFTKHKRAPHLFDTHFQVGFKTMLREDGRNGIRPLTLGRSLNSDLVLDYRTVSARHATIRFRNGEFVYADACSMNGSFLHLREPVKLGSSQPVQLRVGRCILSMEVFTPWNRRLLQAIRCNRKTMKQDVVVLGFDGQSVAAHDFAADSEIVGSTSLQRENILLSMAGGGELTPASFKHLNLLYSLAFPPPIHHKLSSHQAGHQATATLQERAQELEVLNRPTGNVSPGLAGGWLFYVLQLRRDERPGRN
jgi:FHA domain